MPRCKFCGEMLKKGTGKMFVHTDGRVSYFCSMKCEKNMLKLKRNPTKTIWTKIYQDLKKDSAKSPEKKEGKKEERPQKKK